MTTYSLKKPGPVATDVLLPIFGFVWVVVAPKLVNFIGFLLVGISIFITVRRMSLPYTRITTSVDNVGLIRKDGNTRDIPVKDLEEVVEQSATLLFILKSKEKISTASFSSKKETIEFAEFLKQGGISYSYSADDTIGG